MTYLQRILAVKKSVTEEDLLNFLDAKGHLEYRLAGAVFTWLGKDKNILYVGTKGSKKRCG